MRPPPHVSSREILHFKHPARHPGDPGADSGGEERSKWGGGGDDAKKSKEREEEHLGTMFHQTSSKLSLGDRKLLFFSAQSEGSKHWSRFTCSYKNST